METIHELIDSVISKLNHVKRPLGAGVAVMSEREFLGSLSLPKREKSSPSKDKPMIIVGPSGVGKTWLANQVAGITKEIMFDLDTVGFVNKNDEWEIKLDRVPDAAIYAGWGIGAKHVAAKCAWVVLPIPKFETFSTISKAKLRDGKEKGISDVVLDYVKMHYAMSKSEYFKYMESKAMLIIRDLKPNQHLTLVHKDWVPDELSKLKGWFL
jgi:hypothetical protein